MRAKSFAGMNCSIAGAIEAVGDRWGFLILRDMLFGLTRYDAFQKSSGIPAQTLATRLRALEDAGLIHRRQYQSNPPRDEYLLTDQGRGLWKVLAALREWGDQWDAHGTTGAPVDLIDRDTGRPMRLALVDAETGETVPLARAMPTPGPGADARMAFRLRQGQELDQKQD